MARSLRCRGFYDSPLFQIFYDHFESFQEEYTRRFESQFGFYRYVWDETLRRFFECGDPRFGMARYECGRCKQNLYVPFSCKTRLFCPSCHQKKIELWLDDVMDNVIYKDMPHRFWTFSIPKRLRVYFQYRHKLMTHLVEAAKQTVLFAMGDGQSLSFTAPGMITLIQTSGDELNFNCHLHALITDGLVDYADPHKLSFNRCQHYDFVQMTELFRLFVLKILHKHNVIPQSVVDNMLTWNHSGFHVHASNRFKDPDRMRKCLEYSFRPPVTLQSLSYDKTAKTVYYKTKKLKDLSFSAHDFIAHVLQHVPDRYQNMRRYAGCYAANVRLRIQKARAGDKQEEEEVAVIQGHMTNKVNWAKLIAKTFGEMPTQCPRCHEEMKLVGFVFDARILADFGYLKRAPPKMKVIKYSQIPKQPMIETSQSQDQGSIIYKQRMPDYENLDQSIEW
ncbi:transposase zinc-binding domain-containing protein [bacterium]|nr:transposase zinc-binding domain-containing protein [bacterium]